MIVAGALKSNVEVKASSSEIVNRALEGDGCTKARTKETPA